MTVRETAHEMKLASPYMAASSREQRDKALLAVKEALLAEKEAIFSANKGDMEEAQRTGVPVQVQKRLKFGEEKLRDVCAGIDQLVSLEDPVGRVLLKRQMDEGLILERISCPIGVIGVIFEARPDALVQISCLCIKSGNCAVLKGGRETAGTNRVLFDIIHEAVMKAGLPPYCLSLVQAHSEIDELLLCEGDVDLLIPRGSNRFVQYIMDHTKIPVMGHADGVCHIYTDGTLDHEKALRIITDAKIQYPVACNAVETLLVRRDIAATFLPLLKEKMDSVGVKLRGTLEAAKVLAETLPETAGAAPAMEIMEEDGFHKEYGDLILSVKLVEDVKEAADHINRFGSHHTDAILTLNETDADYFLQMVDSAGVYVNCSTRFADGFRYGFGAEVGISTSKLHARGPVGLDGLVTYKYLIRGEGQIVGDYASGKAAFHFKDLS